MNGFDFTPTRHRYRAYPQTLRQLWPLGAPVHGGTALTLFGDGFASYDHADAPHAACRFLRSDKHPSWCEAYDASRLRVVPLRRCLARAIVLRSSPADDYAAQRLGCVLPPSAIDKGNASALRVQLTLNGVDFVDELLDGQVSHAREREPLSLTNPVVFAWSLLAGLRLRSSLPL